MRTSLLCALLLLVLALATLTGREPGAVAPLVSPFAGAAGQGTFAPRGAISASPTSASGAAEASSDPLETLGDAQADPSREKPARSPKAVKRSAAADPEKRPAPITPVWRDDPKAIASVIESPAFLDTASPVARLYFAYFGRSPDVEGFDHYVAQREGGRVLDEISDEFAGSHEIELRYGALDNAAFVDRVFRNVFDGAGDAQQRASWVAQLESGAMTRGQMMLAFSESAAFRAAVANEVFVSIAYTEIFGRSADPAELAHWVGLLDAGNSGEAVIRGLLASR